MADISESIRDGLSQEKEFEFLQESLSLIRELSKRLLLKQSCTSTGQFYFHKVAYAISFRKFNRLIMACACLFLASKTTEQIVKIGDVAYHFLTIKNFKPQSACTKASMDENLLKVSKDIAFHEFHVLAILDFNLPVSLPYLDIESLVAGQTQIFRRVANNFANDCFRSRAVLKYNMKDIAETCVFLAAEFMGIEVNTMPNSAIVAEILQVYNFYL